MNLVGKVVTLKGGDKGVCVCRLDSGEYLLGTGRGCQISRGFFEEDVVFYAEREKSNE